MNKKDVEVYIRVYTANSDTDIVEQPLTFKSWDDFNDDFTGRLEGMGMVDYDVLGGAYADGSLAWGLLQDEAEWDGWNDFFDFAKSAGVDAGKLWSAAMDIYTGEMSEIVTWLEDAYQGEWDSMLDYAYDYIDSVYGTDIPKDLADTYFDWEGFGFALKANGDLSAIIMDDWEDRYDTLAEAEAVYDEMYDMRDDELGEWYVYDLVGDLESALGDKVKDFFDYKKFASDLEYDLYYDRSSGLMFNRNV